MPLDNSVLSPINPITTLRLHPRVLVPFSKKPKVMSYSTPSEQWSTSYTNQSMFRLSEVYEADETMGPGSILSGSF